MSVVTPSATVLATLGGQGFGQQRFDVAETSGETGDTAVNAGAPARWTCSMRSAAWLTLDESAEWEAMLLRLRGGINHLAVYDVLRPAPRGTMRGAPVLGAAVARGDGTALLTNVVGTLNAGDWLQFGTGVGTSQLVKLLEPVSSPVLTAGAGNWVNNVAAAATWVNNAAAPATWSRGGTVTITFDAVAREDFAVGTAVVWDKPVAYYGMSNTTTTWQAGSNGPTLAGYAFDGVEQWG